MRMRRTVGKAMKNIAAMGIEDFSNEKFILYSSSLFDYADVKAEMDYLRWKNQVWWQSEYQILYKKNDGYG